MTTNIITIVFEEENDDFIRHNLMKIYKEDLDEEHG